MTPIASLREGAKRSWYKPSTSRPEQHTRAKAESGEIKVSALYPLDFTAFIADHLDAIVAVFEVGGSETMTYHQLSQRAFEALAQPPRFRTMSPSRFQRFIKVMRLFKPALVSVFPFSLWCMTNNDMVAPAIGKWRIQEVIQKAAR